jgi:hypothetical protein
MTLRAKKQLELALRNSSAQQAYSGEKNIGKRPPIISAVGALSGPDAERLPAPPRPLANRRFVAF